MGVIIKTTSVKSKDDPSLDRCLRRQHRKINPNQPIDYWNSARLESDSHRSLSELHSHRTAHCRWISDFETLDMTSPPCPLPPWHGVTLGGDGARGAAGPGGIVVKIDTVIVPAPRSQSAPRPAIAALTISIIPSNLAAATTERREDRFYKPNN